jgi:hypothetical protein
MSPIGQWIKAEAVRLRRAGKKIYLDIYRRRKRNVAAGHYDEEGIFHPWRASWDYDPTRVGEKPLSRAERARRVKVYTRAKKRRATSRRRKKR